MGSFGKGMLDTEIEITQVSFGGFNKDISAKELTDFLEDECGIIWRCRLKNSWTPPDSFPNFDVDTAANIIVENDYDKVEPHAFVHFASAEATKRAVNASGRCKLLLRGKSLTVNLGPENLFRTNQKRTEIIPFKFYDVRVEIGSLVSRDEFLFGWKGPTSGVNFLIDPFDHSCKILFTKEIAFTFKGTNTHAVLKCNFKMEFSVRDITELKQYRDISSLILLLRLASSPQISYRTADDDIYDSVPFDLLDDEDPWIRTTDFTPGGVIGRCSAYKISISPRFGLKLEKAVNYLKELRIPNPDVPRQKLIVREEPDFRASMSDHFSCIQYKEGINFEILFLVNAVIQKGIFNEHQLSDMFFDLLRNQTKEVSAAALRHIFSLEDPVFDAYEKLKLVQEWLIKNPKLLKSFKGSDDNVEVRRLTITPTKAYCLPPVVELGNRVLRKFREYRDRFLRVTFMDEGLEQLNNNVLTYYVAPIVREITDNSFAQKTGVFKRVKSILVEGFYVCGRKYSFLIFSSGQLRDRSAWFFAEDKKLSVIDIRKWMGKFSDRNVAKCTARMGLCFSSTYATVKVPLKEINTELPDIKRNDYVFSDGIGKLTPDLAMKIAEKLQLASNPPCAYQIRFGGCKGVIACWPGNNDKFRLSLRPSMNKFVSNHRIIEIVSWTRFQPGFLNRQIITLLSALNVPDEIFSTMQDSMICKLDQMLENPDVALDIVTSSCEQETIAAIMLSAGFTPRTEPHLRGMLSSIRAAQLGDLLTRARIFVPSGRWLMGCLDELGVLEHGQCFIQVSTPSFESCVSKSGLGLSEAKRNVKLITGIVVVAKNPCLHPGDIRILEAVGAPGLHHLVDCLVFPQKGDRPHANEASGSDLDGDLYFVTWDEKLVPPSKRSWPPMDYSPAKVKKLQRPVNNSDIIDFFTKNMVNEMLGTICNAHVVHADQSAYGAMDETCLQLAELAALAVDFPKTGKIVTMPHSLKPKMYPDFMDKGDSQSYKSKKILGRLYRKIRDASDGDILSPSELSLASENIAFDDIFKIEGSDIFISDAWNQKCSYDRQLNALLSHYNIKSEEELVTGHLWSMPKCSSRKQGELKEKLKHAYLSLKKEFRDAFVCVGEGNEQLTEEERNTLYEQKASAWYQVTYHPQWIKESVAMIDPDGGKGAPVRLSFAWIPAEYLVRIKIKSRVTNL